MAEFKNNPKMSDDSGKNTVRRFTHQPLTIDHYGIHAAIMKNGKVVITSNVEKSGSDEVEYDEVTVPASLIFKLATLLKATRSVEYVTMEVSGKPSKETEELDDQKE